MNHKILYAHEVFLFVPSKKGTPIWHFLHITSINFSFFLMLKKKVTEKIIEPRGSRFLLFDSYEKNELAKRHSFVKRLPPSFIPFTVSTPKVFFCCSSTPYFKLTLLHKIWHFRWRKMLEKSSKIRFFSIFQFFPHFFPRWRRNFRFYFARIKWIVEFYHFLWRTKGSRCWGLCFILFDVSGFFSTNSNFFLCCLSFWLLRDCSRRMRKHLCISRLCWVQVYILLNIGCKTCEHHYWRWVVFLKKSLDTIFDRHSFVIN